MDVYERPLIPTPQAEAEEAERIIAQRERWALIQRMNAQAGRAHTQSAGEAGEAAPAGTGATAPVLAEGGTSASGAEAGDVSAVSAAVVPAAAGAAGQPAVEGEAAPTTAASAQP